MGVDETLHHFIMECPAYLHIKEEYLEGYRSILGISTFNEVISVSKIVNKIPIIANRNEGALRNEDVNIT